MYRAPHIALIVETSMESGREMLRGIARYAAENGPWSIYHQPSHLDQSLPEWLKNWDGDGMIVRVSDPSFVEFISGLDIPAVDVLGQVSNCDLPLVHVDNHVIASQAFTHLHDRGFREFAFVGRRGFTWSDERFDSFARACKEQNCVCHSFEVCRESPWEIEQDRLAVWLKNLNKPCGLMACNDAHGQRVLEACRRSNILVPEEIAVIGVDNDSVICALADPPLTSIDPGHFQVGYEAARLLDRLIRQPQETTNQKLLKNCTCFTRESTDITAVNHSELAKALAFIRHNACLGITSNHVAKELGVSLSSLKRLFANECRFTINECIIRAKIDRAKQLLRESDSSIEQITSKVGYSHAHYFAAAFRREIGMSPSEYRKKYQRQNDAGKSSTKSSVKEPVTW